MLKVAVSMCSTIFHNNLKYIFFQLDYNSLDIIYISFIQQLLEHGNIVCCNWTQYNKYVIKQIQTEAARTVIGAKC